MSNVAQLIDLIAMGKNAEASDVLNQELLTRSYGAIDQLKPEVAKNYFAPVIDMDTDGNVTPEEPVAPEVENETDVEIGDVEEPTEEESE